MSGDRGIRASGTLARLSVPASGSQHPNSLFRRAVADVFAKARRAGVANPILIGAIPFNQTHPSSLYVPQCHEIFSRDAAVAEIEPARPPQHRLIDKLRLLPDRTDYETGVQGVLDALRDGSADKVVLARLCEARFDRPVEPDWLIQRLIEQNPSGFQFRIPLPDGATLVGVSPELLVRKRGAAIYSNPLAGSARRTSDPIEDAAIEQALRHSEKDLREHRYVVDFIHEILSPLCRTLEIAEQPTAMNTATMWHLSTGIAGILKDPTLSVLQIACALHPTPALCGYPPAAAHRLIERIEPFDREFFAGIVGWCDARGDGEWAVAIRCGKVKGDTVQLFAGAGIVEGSDPEAEWHETTGKLTTMLRAVGVGAIGA
jgi:isochorismate synthase